MTSGDTPKDQVVISSVTTTVRDTMVADVGTIIYNTTTKQFNICHDKVASANSWSALCEVIYGTGAAPTASTTEIGTLYIKYTP